MSGGKGKHLHCRKTKPEKKITAGKTISSLISLFDSTAQRKKVRSFPNFIGRTRSLPLFHSRALSMNHVLFAMRPIINGSAKALWVGAKRNFPCWKEIKKKPRKENLICPIIESRSVPAIKRSPSKSSSRRKVARSRTIFGGKILFLFCFLLKGFPRAVKTRIRWL